MRFATKLRRVDWLLLWQYVIHVILHCNSILRIQFVFDEVFIILAVESFSFLVIAQCLLKIVCNGSALISPDSVDEEGTEIAKVVACFAFAEGETHRHTVNHP